MTAITSAVDELLASVAALAQSMEQAFDPRRFLEQFSSRIQALLPHDRVVVFRRSEDDQTFTVFAEHDLDGRDLYAGFWTTAFDPEARFLIKDWPHVGAVFEGQEVRFDDALVFTDLGPFERRVVDAGVRAGLVVPLRGRGGTVAAFGVTSRTPARYTDAHATAAHALARLIAPIVENAFLVQRERQRRDRMVALHKLAQELGSSLDLRGIFRGARQIMRPILDFDVMGVTLVAPSGRDLELLAVVDDQHKCAEDPTRRIPLDSLSFADRVAAGERVLIRDAPTDSIRTARAIAS
ncbi:MAG: GAF domain-containing protein [Planctomycetota bacterium]